MRSKVICTVSIAILFFVSCLYISPSAADPLDNWHVRAPSLTTASLSSIAYGNGVFVAVGGSTIITSPDGEHWAVWSGGFGSLYSVTYGNGIFVASGQQNQGASYAWYTLISRDGLTWNEGSYTYPYPSSVTYGNGKFVAVGFWSIATSQDGEHWTHFDTKDAFRSITYSNEEFIALAQPYDKGNHHGYQLGTSFDGTTWSYNHIYPDDSVYFYDIAYGRDRFAAVGAAGGCSIPCYRQRIVTSFDAMHWTEMVNNDGEMLEAITYGIGNFIAVGGNEIVTSADGVNWKKITVPNAKYLLSVTNNGNTFVAVGTDGMILQSDPIAYQNEPVGVPTMNEWGIMLFLVMAGLGAIFNLGNHPRVS
ncbi:MAG: hypothetical protein WA610_10885 [Thermodesulfovibrionales bacterium]